MNLGQDPLFPDSADDVNPIVMNGISTGTSNHDFFSQVGNGYLLGEVEPCRMTITITDYKKKKPFQTERFFCRYFFENDRLGLVKTVKIRIKVFLKKYN